MTINSISVSNEKLTMGSTVTVTVTAKNDSNERATFTRFVLSGTISVPYTDQWGNETSGSIALGHMEQTGSWAYNATKTFTFDLTLNAVDLDGNTIEEQLAALLESHSADTRANEITWDLYAEADAFTSDSDSAVGGVFLDAFYAPTVANFDLERCLNGVPNDEGENLLTTLKLQVSEKARTELLTLKLHYAEGEAATTQAPSIDLTPHISELLTGVTDSAELITDTFANTGNWNFLLVFGDDYESAGAVLSVPKAFANVHLSGKSTGGVAFGGFSTSEESSPKLECYYPGYFYGGIQGVNHYSTEEVKTGGTWIDGKPIYRKTYVYEAGASSYATLDLSDLDFEIIRIVDFVHHTKYKNAGSYWSGNYYWASGDATRCYVNGTNLILRSADNITTSTGAWVTVEYTKTTD